MQRLILNISLFSFVNSNATSTSSSYSSTRCNTKLNFLLYISSSITLIIEEKNGFVIPLTKTAILFVSVRFKFLALLFGTNPVSSTTCIIFAFVSALISALLFNALETVLTLTPHLLAMSFIVISAILTPHNSSTK